MHGTNYMRDNREYVRAERGGVGMCCTAGEVVRSKDRGVVNWGVRLWWCGRAGGGRWWKVQTGVSR
jgi:hypothetical protein